MRHERYTATSRDLLFSNPASAHHSEVHIIDSRRHVKRNARRLRGKWDLARTTRVYVSHEDIQPPSRRWSLPNFEKQFGTVQEWFEDALKTPEALTAAWKQPKSHEINGECSSTRDLIPLAVVGIWSCFILHCFIVFTVFFFPVLIVCRRLLPELRGSKSRRIWILCVTYDPFTVALTTKHTRC